MSPAGERCPEQEPVNLDWNMDAIKLLKDYWFSVVVLPTKTG